MCRPSEHVGGTEINGDPLRVLRHRPQIAIQASVLDLLKAYRVEIPAFGLIPAEQTRDLPLALLTVLAAAGLVGRPAT